MASVFYVALGGALGASLRYGCALATARFVAASGLWATLTVNVLGSLAMGVFMGWWVSRPGAAGGELHAFLAVGVLGGFTTYSAYAFETAALIERGAISLAAGYAIGTMVACVAAVFLGMALTVRSAA